MSCCSCSYIHLTAYLGVIAWQHSQVRLGGACKHQNDYASSKVTYDEPLHSVQAACPSAALCVSHFPVLLSDPHLEWAPSNVLWLIWQTALCTSQRIMRICCN